MFKDAKYSHSCFECNDSSMGPFLVLLGLERRGQASHGDLDGPVVIQKESTSTAEEGLLISLPQSARCLLLLSSHIRITLEEAQHSMSLKAFVTMTQACAADLVCLCSCVWVRTQN